MIKKDIPFIVPLLGGLVFALGAWIMQFLDEARTIDNWIQLGLQISETAGFFMLLVNGTFIKTKFFRYSKGVIAIVILGILFRIMHWPYGQILFSVGFLGIPVCYVLSFIQKSIKKRLDILKLLWVVLAFGGGTFSTLHWINDEYRILSTVLIWIASMDYLLGQKPLKQG